jgi:hypothetical protein
MARQGRLGTNQNLPKIKITGIHLIGMYLIGVHLTGVHLLHLLQVRATRGRAGLDFWKFLICLGRHTTVLGGMWWCVMVPPNGSVSFGHFGS